MNNRTLTIITEGGNNFGFGHITRCLSISSIFEQYNFNIDFIINGDDSLSSILKGVDYNIFNWLEEEKLIKQLEDSSLILIDSIEITNELILKIESLNIPIIFIDDEKRRNILTRGFVVDWTVLSETKNYFLPKKKDVLYLLGSKYTPLRKEFSNASKNRIKQNIESIMVTFGGSDIRNLMPIVLKTLVKKFPNMRKNIVVGAGFNNTKKIEKYVDKNTKLIYNADTAEMISLMQNNDIAIASGGQTLYELARIGTPTIAILVVENADDDTIGWDKVGSIKNIGWYNDENLIEKLVLNINNLKDKRFRIYMQNRANEYINSNGAKLLVNTIMGTLNDSF